MKKFILSLFCGVLICFFVMPTMAQELTQKRKTTTFSPALIGTSQAQKGQVKKSLPKMARTTILRYEPGQIELSEVQKELLLHVVKQINDMHGSITVVATGASKNEKIASERVGLVERFLRAYVSKYFNFSARFISPEHVVASIDNTVKIIINR